MPPNIVKPPKTLNEPICNKDKAKVDTDTTTIDWFLVSLFFTASLHIAEVTSKRATVEVKAATTSNAKNKIAKIKPPTILPNI